MKIYVNGCSFTYGDELVNPKSDSWPSLIGKKINAEVTNEAVSGGTNQRILYRTIKNLNKDYDLYLIAWTLYSRFTFYKSDNNYEVNFNPQLNHELYGNEKYYRHWGEILYKHWYNDLYAFKLWLQQIIQLQSVLKDQNYMMINTVPNFLDKWLVEKENFIDSVKEMINFDTMNDEQIFDEYQEIQYYIDSIDKNKFYKWKEFSISDINFPKGSGGHILEQGHDHISELIIEHLCLR